MDLYKYIKIYKVLLKPNNKDNPILIKFKY